MFKKMRHIAGMDQDVDDLIFGDIDRVHSSK